MADQDTAAQQHAEHHLAPQQQPAQQPDQQPGQIMQLNVLRSNEFLARQDWLTRNQTQRDRVDQENRAAAVQRQADQKLRNCIAGEAEQISNCEGSTTRGLREWIRAMKAAAPQASDVYIKNLISRTAQGDLFKEMQVFLNQHGPALTSTAAVIQHTLESFLGPDEHETLKDEVKKVKQSS